MIELFSGEQQEPALTAPSTDDLSGADFSEYDFSGFSFQGFVLRGICFYKANLEDVDFGGCILYETRFSSANLARANFTGCYLSFADFSFANLNGANLHGAEIRGCTLECADLSNADFRTRRGEPFELDDNLIRGVRFWPDSADPYSVLRREYSGLRFIVLLLLTLLALLPYVTEALLWSSISHGQGIFHTAREKMSLTLNEMVTTQQLNESANERILGMLGSLDPSVSDDWRTTRVIWIVTGLESGWLAFVFALVMLGYLVARAYLTIKINAMRDDEERSGHTPPKNEYLKFLVFHRVIRVVMWVAISSAIYHAAKVLLLTIHLPK